MGWLRAAVLGANDGLLSTASLVVGVAASGASHSAIVVSGVAGLVGGAMSMAAGEFVSVSSHADMEHADLALERAELLRDEPGEREELAGIYVKRGLTPALAREVAEQLMRKDALGAHARDEHGITETSAARPLQAALTSAASFFAGGVVPVLVGGASPRAHTTALVTGITLLLLTVLGAGAAQIGGASKQKGAVRILFWGSAAMGLAAIVGRLFGATI